jgi:glycosyltransferase involved in cell wall biosynthesis
MGYRRRIAAFVRFALASAFKAAALGGDVVLATSTPLTIAIPALYASWRKGTPMVFEVRDMWPDVPIALGALKNPLIIGAARLLERSAYRRAKHIVVLAPGMRDDLVAKGVPAAKVTVIPNGCDAELSPSEGSAARARSFFASTGARKILLYAGTIGKANGCDYLIPLAGELQRRRAGMGIIVMGDGSEKERLITEADRAGVLSRTLFFLDPLPKQELAGWLEEADMHIALMRGPRSYLKDAVNNKFFDAVAAGRPIANNFDGFQSRVAAEADIGLVIDALDHARAASQLVDALRDESWLAGVPERARTLAEGRFSYDHLAPCLERILREAAEQPA